MPFTIPNAADATSPDQAEVHSRDIDALVLAYGGTGVLSGCAVTAQGSPDTTVAVAAGAVVSDGGYVAVTAGNVTMTAADATNPRLDLVYVSSAGVKTWLAGTAAANPTPPAIPAGGVPLAFVYMPANDNVVNGTQITDKRVVIRNRGAGALVVAASNSLASVRAQADYVCTGSGDQATINAALTAAGTLATVIIAAGSYATSAAIVLATGQSLVMRPQATITRSGTGNGIELIGLVGTRKNGMTIQGGRIIGPSVGGTQVVGSGVKVEYADKCYIRDVFVSGFGSGGNEGAVEIQRSTEIEVSGCELTNSKNGLCTGQPANTTTEVERCRIVNNIVYSNYDDGIHTQRSKYMLIVGNIAHSHPNGGAADGAGIDTLGDEYDTITGNICFNNNRGIEVGNTADGTYPDIGHTIAGNTCANNTAYGFTIIGRVKDCTWSANAAKNNTTDGFRVGTATSTINIEDVVISDNAVHDCGTSGIDVFGFVSRTDVRGNHLSGHSTADIRVRVSTGTPTDITIEHNRCQSTTRISHAGTNTIVKDNRGDVGGMEITLGPFNANDLAASATVQAQLGFFNTATAVSRGTFDVRMDRAGRVVGAFIVTDTARTAGTATVQVRINGTATAFLAGAVVVDATNTSSDSGFDEMGLAFTAGQTVGAAVVTASWAPTTANAVVFLVIRLD